MVNDADGQFLLHLWRLNEGRDYGEFAAHIGEEMRRIEAGEEGLGHPDFASLVAESESGELSTTITPGIYGFACIKFLTSGDRDGIWAVGPLEAG